MSAPQPYTLDRVVRLVISTIVVVGILLLIRRLSDVLIPFFIAVFLVYLINPMVVWVGLVLHIKRRIWAVVISLTSLLVTVCLFLMWIVPLFVNEMVRMGTLVTRYIEKVDYTDIIPGNMEVYLKDFLEKHRVSEFLDPSNLSALVERAITHMGKVIEGSWHVLTVLAGAAIVLLYVVFLLLDFENLKRKWPGLVPLKYRGLAVEVVDDLEHGMHTYFRMQGLIASIVGVLFAIGFSIIGLPLGIIMGLFLGFLNLVPYLQLVGLIPALLLALLGALDSGHSFWYEAFLVLLVVTIVQMFQDLYLTPKIMGKAYGLNPAVILLSLSVWGSLLGFIGLLLALPLTTILVSYYKRFVLHHDTGHSGIIISHGADSTDKSPPSNSL
jgi:predicted PurR-regulated permease PerM